MGLINTNWGGTAIQDWSSTEALAKCDALPPSPAELPGALPGASRRVPQDGGNLGVSTHLFNAMISPLLNTTIKAPPSLSPYMYMYR